MDDGVSLPASPTTRDFDEAFKSSAMQTYKTFGQLMVRAWTDPDFAQQLRADPEGKMREAGIPLPDDYHIDPEKFVILDAPRGVSVESLRAGTPQEMANISCAGSASSLSCPSCTASCAGSAGC